MLLNKHREKQRQAAPRAIVTLSEQAKHQGLVRMWKGEFGGEAHKDKQEKTCKKRPSAAQKKKIISK